MAVRFHVTDFPTDYAPSKHLADFLLKALEVGATRVRGGEQVVPMLIVDCGGKYDLVAFTDVGDADIRPSACAELRKRGPTFDAYALLYGATLTGDDFGGEINAVAA